ncbi:MAG: glycosyltransferase [Anaerolineae bacterium]
MSPRNSLRIAMLSVHTCPLATLGGKETGGMNVYVRDLSRELGRRGFLVDVFTRTQDPEVVGPRPLGENGRVIHIPAGPLAPYDKKLLYNHLPEFVEGVKRFAQEEEISYDIIHSHYWLSGLVAWELRNSWNLPVMQMFHTLGHMKNLVARSDEERETETRLQAEREIMGLVDRLVAANPLEKRQMVKLYGADPKKIEVIPCGVDLSLFRPVDISQAQERLGWPPDRQMVLFIGRIQPLKGIDILLKAIALATDDLPDLCGHLGLTIIGGNPQATMDREMLRLTRLKKKLGISDLVTFLGARDQDTLLYYYSAAQVCVVPSYYESFGMVALEAMACGAPVIASNVGGLTFTVKDGVTGYLVPDGDPAALSEKLKLILTDEKVRRQMGEEGIKTAQRYRWPLVANKITSLYGQLLTQPVPVREEASD